MYAIVEIAGHQFKVAQDQKLFVHRLDAKEGTKVSFDNVLLLDDGKKVTVGAPAITGALVEAKVTHHLKGDKVIVFKKKRRKGYRVKNGHRQALTELIIERITTTATKKTVASKKAALVKEEKLKVQVETKKEVSSKKKPVPKKVTPKKTIAKTDLSSKTVANLKAMAKDKNVAGYSSMKKSDLIKALS